MPAFTIQLNDLRDEMRAWSFPITQEWLANALRDTNLRPPKSGSAGLLKVSAQRNGPSDVLVHGHIQTHMVTDCARCLQDAHIDVDVPMIVMMSPLTLQTEQNSKKEIDVDEDDMLREYYEGPELVLDDVVRQHIILEEPMQPLCDENCKGIDFATKKADLGKATTETGEQIDARLAPLLKFKQKLPTNEE